MHFYKIIYIFNKDHPKKLKAILQPIEFTLSLPKLMARAFIKVSKRK